MAETGRLWQAEVRDLVFRARMGERPYPVEVTLDFIPSVENIRTALRVARETDPRVKAVVHRRDWSDPQAKSHLEVRVGEFDPNPPAFLERHAIPL